MSLYLNDEKLVRIVAVFSNLSERGLVQARIGRRGEMNSLSNGTGASYVPGWLPLSIMEVIVMQWQTKVVQRTQTPLSSRLRGVFLMKEYANQRRRWTQLSTERFW